MQRTSAWLSDNHAAKRSLSDKNTFTGGGAGESSKTPLYEGTGYIAEIDHTTHEWKVELQPAEAWLHKLVQFMTEARTAANYALVVLPDNWINGLEDI